MVAPLACRSRGPRAIGLVAWMSGAPESLDTALDTWLGAGLAATTAPDR
jgi:hypothetical protein